MVGYLQYKFSILILGYIKIWDILELVNRLGKITENKDFDENEISSALVI